MVVLVGIGLQAVELRLLFGFDRRIVLLRAHDAEIQSKRAWTVRLYPLVLRVQERRALLLIAAARLRGEVGTACALQILLYYFLDLLGSHFRLLDVGVAVGVVFLFVNVLGAEGRLAVGEASRLLQHRHLYVDKSQLKLILSS